MFQATPYDTLTLDGVAYRIAEHPAAPGMPHGQEGRAGIVYRLMAPADGADQALKVFKPRFRLPYLVAQAERIAPYAGLPGLAACRRTVLTPQRHAALLRQHPDLTYAVLMPWIEGPTWQEVLLEKKPLAPEQALALARGLAEVLMGMEEQGIAHCDLSAPNVMLPALAPSPNPQSPVQLVDLEGLYAPGMLQPQALSSGSAGYAHRQAADGLWGPEADRFAGAVLLAEMLGWCDPQVVEAAWGESYFDPVELQTESQRYQLLATALQRQWGEAVATLFDRAWRSETLADCPTFGEWLLHLPANLVAGQTSKTSLSVTTVTPESVDSAYAVVRGLMQVARRLEEQGKLESALEVYHQAQELAAGEPGLHLELDAVVRDLRQRMQYHVGSSTLATIPGKTSSIVRNESVAEVDAGRQETTSGSRRTKWLWMPVVFVLLALGVLAVQTVQQQARERAFATAVAQAQATRVVEAQVTATAQAQTTATAQVQATVTAQAQAAATAQAQSTATARAVTTATAYARVTATAQAQATATAQAQATATRQAQVTATAQAWLAKPVLGIGNATQIRLRSSISAHANWISAVDFSPDGTLLASSAWDNTVKVWRVQHDRLSEYLTLRHDGQVEDVAFSPKGQLLASSGCKTSFSAENPCRQGKIYFWSLNDGKLIRTIEAHDGVVGAIAFSPNGELLASASDDRTVWLWWVSDGRPLYNLQGHTSTVVGVTFSADGQILASSGDRSVRLWRVADGTLLRALEGHTVGAGSATFSPDGRWLAAVGGDDYPILVVWEVNTGQRIYQRGDHALSAGSIAFSPDGAILATGGGHMDKTIQIRRSSDGQPLATLVGHEAWVADLAFSPDGRLLVSGSGDRTLKVWSVP